VPPALTLLTAALASAAEAPIPLEPGTFWVYRESYTQRLGGLDATEDEQTRFEVRGSRARPFILQTGGFDPASAPVETGEGWIRLGPWTGEEALPLPLEVGRAGPRAEGDGEAWTVEAEEEIAVPAGSFRALRCAFRTRGSVAILWIAPGVGVVREAYGPPGARPEIERVLLRWGTPKRPAP
jgi:hypothetical protein